MTRLLTAVILWTAVVSGAWAQTAKSTKVTVLVRGAHCDDCVKAVRKQLRKVKGVKFDPEDLEAGESPRYFSEPFEVEVGHALETGIGAVAKAVASAKTAHRNQVAPRLHLVLFSDARIDEESVSDLRAALRSVNGVLVEESGGLGAIIRDELYWIRLEPAGGAELEAILSAAKKVTDVRLTE